jgi:hypothetical protein
MATIELVTEQFGYDEDGNAWKLISRDKPQRWEKVKSFDED